MRGPVKLTEDPKNNLAPKEGAEAQTLGRDNSGASGSPAAQMRQKETERWPKLLPAHQKLLQGACSVQPARHWAAVDLSTPDQDLNLALLPSAEHTGQCWLAPRQVPRASQRQDGIPT